MTYKFKFKDEAGYYTTVKTVANDQERQEYIDREWRECQGLCINYVPFIHPSLINQNQTIKTK